MRQFLCLWFLAGALSSRAQDLSSEKHHILLLENEQVRVYHLTLAPDEATSLHLHGHPYAYLGLQNARISNEGPGHKPIVIDVTTGDVHTSKGGFKLVERNVGSSSADLIVLERLGDAATFSEPMADYKMHDAALGPIFEQPGMRAYMTRMAVAGRTEPHPELHDRLIVAVTDVQLADKAMGQGPVTLKLKSGEVKWFSKGENHTLSNTGNAACSFITFEFP